MSERRQARSRKTHSGYERTECAHWISVSDDQLKLTGTVFDCRSVLVCNICLDLDAVRSAWREQLLNLLGS